MRRRTARRIVFAILTAPIVACMVVGLYLLEWADSLEERRAPWSGI